jgi:hypothetical protein
MTLYGLEALGDAAARFQRFAYENWHTVAIFRRENYQTQFFESERIHCDCCNDSLSSEYYIR